jgi:acyl-CoA thioester hydrolase
VRAGGPSGPDPGPPGGPADDGAAGRRLPASLAPVARSHTHRLRVRYGECDPQGVVFNAHYFAYFDVALTELWREVAGSYTAMMEQGVDLQVVEATARYKAPARFDDEIDVTIEVAKLGTTSLVTALAIRRDGTLLVEGELAHVFVDARTLTKIPIPDRIRTALEG